MNVLLAIAASVLGAVLVAWVARRLLGAQRVSAGRTLVAAALGLALGWGVWFLLDRNADVTSEDAVVTGAVLALLFTMIVVIGFELTGRPGARAARGDSRRNPVRAARDSWSDTRRASEIVSVARRNGLFTATARVFSDEATQQEELEFGRSLRCTFELILFQQVL